MSSDPILLRIYTKCPVLTTCDQVLWGHKIKKWAQSLAGFYDKSILKAAIEHLTRERHVFLYFRMEATTMLLAGVNILSLFISKYCHQNNLQKLIYSLDTICITFLNHDVILWYKNIY